MPLVYTYNPVTGYTVNPLVSSSGVPAGGTTGQFLSKNSNTDGDVVWATASGSGDVTLAGVQTFTGAKTFGAAGNVSKLLIAGTTSGTVTLDATAAASGTLILPNGPDTLVGRATTDTLTNKTLTAPVLGGTITGTYTLGGTPTFPSSIATLTGTQTFTNKTLTSPVIDGTLTGTAFGTGVAAFLATPSSANLRTALTDETGDSTLMFAFAPVAITTNTTLTQGSHFNRQVTSAESADRTHAVSATATNGDFLTVVNKGTAKLAFTGVTFAAGYRIDEILPGEVFQAVYDGTQWVSVTPVPPYLSQINSQSVAYTLVSTDAGKTIYHPAADTTARIWTIPANASVAFPVGTVIKMRNELLAGALTISITTDTLTKEGSAGGTGSRTLAAGCDAVLQKYAATSWVISGGAGLT